VLIAAGADIEARNTLDNRPLHVAATYGRPAVAKLLLAAGADVNARQPGSGFTPLRSATYGEGRNAAMAELLLAHGADPRGAEEPPPPQLAR